MSKYLVFVNPALLSNLTGNRERITAFRQSVHYARSGLGMNKVQLSAVSSRMEETPQYHCNIRSAEGVPIFLGRDTGSTWRALLSISGVEHFELSRCLHMW